MVVKGFWTAQRALVSAFDPRAAGALMFTILLTTSSGVPSASTAPECSATASILVSLAFIPFLSAAKSLETRRQKEKQSFGKYLMTTIGIGSQISIGGGETVFSATVHVGHVEITTRQLNGTFGKSWKKNLGKVE